MESGIYLRELNRQLTYLFAYARKLNEIDTAAALSGEFRGAQDAGWTTTITAYEVFGELKALATKGAPLTRPELRQILCLYTQLSEAGGVYEGLLNTMHVAQLKGYNLWPFQDLVRVRRQPHAIVGPNANAMFRRLAQVATEIGMTGLAHLFEITFRDDIRNGIAHADYILGPDGLRLRRRNGGNAMVLPFEEVQNALQIGLYFFELLGLQQQTVAESFRPARKIVGRFSANPPMSWTIELTEDGRFSISSNALAPQVDDAYERQRRITDRLGGWMVAAYVTQARPVSPILMSDIYAAGFDVLVVDLKDTQRFEDLLAEVEEHGLWDPPAGAGEAACLVVTPMGFRWIATGAEFQAWLPIVEEIEVA
ncbi:hypothetical protein MKK58_07990 [Methylobacterium sp. J-078]|uniref:hypothetical protein n=1 Tax=Methylobacterium sp. J-078 TaxID=2836657 RepID=UPI001FB867E3|nr:hypothetical protein [Methylobacterium sp. J-078]MCJ2044472.1 hypothetical protein [Methylobacterium sp. J-078]